MGYEVQRFSWCRSPTGGGTVNHIASPLTFLNGTSAVSSDIYYVDLKDEYRLVYLAIYNLALKNFPCSHQAFQLPESFKPLNDSLMFPLSEYAVAGSDDGNSSELCIFVNGKSSTDTINGSNLKASVMYLAKS